MLVQFEFKNFMSFRCQALFSMLAGSEKEHAEILLQEKIKDSSCSLGIWRK